MISTNILNQRMYDRLRSRNSYGLSDHNEEEESQMVADIKSYRESAKDAYMRSLLNPETHLAKIPSRMPSQTAVSQLKTNFTITPNTSGKFVLVIDPFVQQYSVASANTVDGIGGGSFTTSNFAQDANIIDQWRLVSSSVVLRYYGNFNQMSGFFVAATVSGLASSSATPYLTFSNVEDFQNKEVIKCIDGVKMIYSPLDERANEFQAQTAYSGNSHQCRWQYLFVVIGDAFPNSACIRVDYTRVIEYTSLPSLREYINHTIDQPSDYVKPAITATVGSAPPQSTPGVTIKPPDQWVQNKLFDDLTKTAKDEVGKMFKDVLANEIGSFLPSNRFGLK